jgi:integrase
MGKDTPLDAQNTVNRHFKPLLKHGGLPYFASTVSGTRAPPALGTWRSPKLVQRLLGNASITMTLDCYSHWIPSMGRRAATGMDEALGE